VSDDSPPHIPLIIPSICLIQLHDVIQHVTLMSSWAQDPNLQFHILLRDPSVTPTWTNGIKCYRLCSLDHLLSFIYNLSRINNRLQITWAATLEIAVNSTVIKSQLWVQSTDKVKPFSKVHMLQVFAHSYQCLFTEVHKTSVFFSEWVIFWKSTLKGWMYCKMNGVTNMEVISLF